MKGFRGFVAIMLLLLWGPASIASPYAQPAPCRNCTQQEKQAAEELKELKLSKASQPNPNQFQVQQQDPSSLPFLGPEEFAFACPTLLGRALPATTRGRGPTPTEGFFARLLEGSIAAQAP